MTVFLVWVRYRNTGRFVDSIWIQKAHAEQRVKELKESLANMGHSATTDVKSEWFVWWSAATASDAVLGVSE